MKIVSKFQVYIFHTFREISCQIASRSGRLIVLNDLASPKMVIKICVNIFRYFLNVLELFECRRGPYMTSFASLTRNYVA